jgi:hypothetical protein
MANLPITAADVGASTATGDGAVQAGEAIDAGEAIYIKASDNMAYLTDASDLTKVGFVGIAVNSAAAGQIVHYATGLVTVTTGVVVATFYFVSSTPGKLCLESDLVTDDYKVLAAVGTVVTQLNIRPWSTTTQVP